MNTKEVYVTVRLTVPEDTVMQDLINELGYQFTYTDEQYNERIDRKSTRLNSSHSQQSRMPSSA